MNNITDKELLAICNLSNLKMEFADIVERVEEVDNPAVPGQKIKNYVNHTISTLIDKEIEAIQARKKLQKDCEIGSTRKLSDGDYENLKKTYSTLGENMNPNTKQLYLEQKKLRDQEEKYKSLITEDKYLGSFYNVYKSRKKEIIYNSKEELQKEAPIIMEYYDRFQHGNGEGDFLKDWEIVYSGDYYEALVDFIICNDNNISKALGIDSTNAFSGDKIEYKENNGINFREDLITLGNRQKNATKAFNLTFDLIVTFLGLTSTSKISDILGKLALDKTIIENIFNTNTFGAILSLLNDEDKKAIHSLLNNEDKISDILGKPALNKTIIENTFNTNTFETTASVLNDEDKKAILSILKEKLGKKDFLSLNLITTLEILGIRIVITKKKDSNDFIVAFNNFDNNEIIKDLEKGILSFNLSVFNVIIEDILLKKALQSSEVNIYFTGYEDGATLATACYLTNDFISEKNSNENSNNIPKINCYNKPFIGSKRPNFLELINFNVYDIEYNALNMRHTSLYTIFKREELKSYKEQKFFGNLLREDYIDEGK